MNLIGWIPLLYFKIAAIITATIAAINLTLFVALQWQFTSLITDHNKDTNVVTSIAISPTSYHKLKKRINLTWNLTLIFSIFTIILILIFSKYNKMALKYGAYDNIQLAQTIDKIKSSESVGFTESENIPDDLRGCLIFYFKYGCPDCGAIHDEFMDYIKTNSIKNIYFVSSRSERGKKLLEQYPVDEVPAIVYVRIKESEISKTYTEVLYEKIKNKNNDETTVFRKDKLNFVIERQLEGE